MTEAPDPLRHLSEVERSCVQRYISLVQERLGPELERLALFGSAARGDMWDAGSPMHSDIDLLVVTRSQLPDGVAEELVNETYPLYLECGRQIGPQFRTQESLGSAAFAENVTRDGVLVWGQPSG